MAERIVFFALILVSIKRISRKGAKLKRTGRMGHGKLQRRPPVSPQYKVRRVYRRLVKKSATRRITDSILDSKASSFLMIWSSAAGASSLALLGATGASILRMSVILWMRIGGTSFLCLPFSMLL